MTVTRAQWAQALIDHLQQLKSGGLRFVNVRPETLRMLESLQTAPPAAPHRAVALQRAAGPDVVLTRPALIPDASAGSRPPAAPLVAPASPAPENRSAPILGDARIAALREVQQRASVCVKCPHLASSRQTVVFGVGDPNSPLMFVGEAPGADEDEQGEPFVGRAGQLLTRIIETMGFARNSVYIANILKCRPDTPGQKYGNRKPTSEEMATCLPYLLEQIDLIQPRVIVALGATAVEGLLGRMGGITRLRGNWQSFRGTPLMPTYHPAYLLRSNSLQEKRNVWEDMLLVLEKLGRPITDKQRGYFLKA